MKNPQGQETGKPVESQSPDESASVRPDARTARTGRPGAAGDAPPTNRASHTCNEGFFLPLRWGVDSLYLSYAGTLDPRVDDKLQKLKQIAQAQEPHQQSQAQYPVGTHIFEVKDKGAKLFPYILEDGAFRIQLSRSGKTVPLAYVKVSSGCLADMPAAEAEKMLRDILGAFGEVAGEALASRIDLYVDFVSSVDMESWGREAWVTRAAQVSQYAVDGKFSGWSIGLGGVMSCRLYNKTLELNVSKKTYLLPLWRETGWDGKSSVWRLEFQFKREILKEHGLSTLRQVLNHLNGLWSYATTEWLRLTLPNPEDQTRSRWPVHPLWGYLSSIDWENPGGPVYRTFTPVRAPSSDKLFSMGLASIIGYMARERMTDLYAGVDAYLAALYKHHEDKANGLGLSFDSYIAEKVAIKARQFNSMLNADPEAELEDQADAYRRASKGG